MRDDTMLRADTAALDPFRLDIAPEQAISHRLWAEAADDALAGMLAGPGLTVLIGEVGTGKTLMLRNLQRQLRAFGCDVSLLTGTDVVREPEPGAVGDSGLGVQYILIDDARRAAALLPTLSVSRDLHVLLAERPPFETRLRGLRPPPAVVRLGPLPPDEAREFVAARLAQAGEPADLLTAEAIELLVARSGGIPGTLATLGAKSLETAKRAGARQITADHVATAGRPNEEPLTRRPAAPVSTRERIAGPISDLESRPDAHREGQTKSQLALLQGWQALAGRRRWIAAAGILVLLSAGIYALATAEFGPAQQARGTRPARAGSAPPAPVVGPSQPSSRGSPARNAEPGAATTAATLTAAAGASRVTRHAAMPTTPATPVPPTPTHLVLDYPRSSRQAAGRAAMLVDHLRQAGFTVGNPVPARGSSRSSALHVFFSEDGPAAQQLQAALGSHAPEIRTDPPHLAGSLPRPGTLELTVLAQSPAADWARALDQEPARTGALQASSPPGLIQTFEPADGATVKLAQPGIVALSWVDRAGHVSHYFVEVDTLDGAAPHEIFASYEDDPPITVGLDPASRHYAWRVHAVDRVGHHYTSSRWFQFTISTGSVAKQ